MIYRYPALYRIQALFGSLLAGIILMGSVLAEIEAANLPDAFLHVFGFAVSSIILILGLDFATRRIWIKPAGVQTRWLRQSFMEWSQILDWSYRPFGLIHIRLKRGLGWYIWPLMDGYTEILTAIDQHQTAPHHSKS
jgi:hypothetical protein